MLWDMTHTFPDGYVLQAYLNLMNFALLHFTIHFLQIESLWQPCVVRWWLATLEIKYF